MKNKIYTIIILLSIFLLILITTERFKDFREGAGEVIFPEINDPDLSLLENLSVPMKEYIEWESENKDLRMQYPDNWTDVSSIVSAAEEKKGIRMEGGNVLLVLQRMGLDSKNLSFLTIIEFNTQESQDSVLQKIKEDFSENNTENEISFTEKNDKYYVEISSESSDGLIYYSKARIIYLENKTYIIITTSPKEAWTKIETEINKILDSI